jgi:hypothetical protein
MELLLILLYTSICIAVLKIFRIPVNQWSLSTAVLGGSIRPLSPGGQLQLKSACHHTSPTKA